MSVESSKCDVIHEMNHLEMSSPTAIENSEEQSIGDHDDQQQPSFMKQARFWLSQTYPDWKQILAAEFGQVETICVPDSLDVGPNKFFGPTKPAAGFDKEETRKARSRLTGEKGEEDFFIAFRKLKLGGILINGFDTRPFLKVMLKNTVPGFEEMDSYDKHFECDFIFIHQHVGLVVVETKACKRVDEVLAHYKKADDQLRRQISGLQSIYGLISNENECPLNTHRVVCMPNIDLTTEPTASNKKLEKIIHSYSHDFLYKSLLQNVENFKEFWVAKKTARFALTEGVISFIVALFSYRPAKFMSATCNALEIYRRIETQEFKNTKMSSSKTILFNNQQLEAIESEAQRVVIFGPPGTGKTLCLIQRALSAAKKDKPGRVIMATLLTRSLITKFRKICAENRSEDIKRPPLCAPIFAFENFSPDDDIFIDETFMRQSQKYFKEFSNRELSTGSTTVVITGFIFFDEILDLQQIGETLPEFKQFELTTVLRGTKTIIDEWKTRFPDRFLRIGHNITGTTIERFSIKSSELLDMLSSKVMALLKPLSLPASETRAGDDPCIPSYCRPCDVAIITVAASFADQYLLRSVIREHFPILCGSIQQHVRNESVLAVDDEFHAHSCEWPIVIVVQLQYVRPAQCFVTASSRAIAKLIIITLEDSKLIDEIDLKESKDETESENEIEEREALEESSVLFKDNTIRVKKK